MRPVRSADNLTTFMCRLSLNLETSTSWNSQGPVQVCNGTALPFQGRKTFKSFGEVKLVRNVMAHAQKPEFVFPRNGRVHLNRWGRPLSRLLTVEECGSVVVMIVMLDRLRSEVNWNCSGYPLHSPVPLHFPSRASPCVTRFRTSYTTVLKAIFTKLALAL